MLSKLIDIQTRNAWTDAEMARRLHVARSTWTDVRNGRLPISAKLQMSAARAFSEVVGDLLGQLSHSHQEGR